MVPPMLRGTKVETLLRTTPAVTPGITDHVWSGGSVEAALLPARIAMASAASASHPRIHCIVGALDQLEGVKRIRRPTIGEYPDLA